MSGTDGYPEELGLLDSLLSCIVTDVSTLPWLGLSLLAVRSSPGEGVQRLLGAEEVKGWRQEVTFPRLQVYQGLEPGSTVVLIQGTLNFNVNVLSSDWRKEFRSGSLWITPSLL